MLMYFFLPSFQFCAYLTTIIMDYPVIKCCKQYIFLIPGMDFNEFQVYFKILQANLQTAPPTSRANQGRKRKSDSLNTLKI